MSKRERPAEGRGATSDLVVLAGRDEGNANGEALQAVERLHSEVVSLETKADLVVADTSDDWESDKDIVCWEQPRTKVYWNRRGQTIIAQQEPYPNENVFLLFNPDALPSLIRALAQHIGHSVAEDISEALDKNYM